MVHCAAVNCNNNTYKKGQNTGVSLYHLPIDKSRKIQSWLFENNKTLVK